MDDVRGVGGVGGGVGYAGEVEGFAALNAGAAAAAVEVAAFVARPCLGEGHAELGTAAYDVGLCPVDEGANELDLFPVGEADGDSHGIGELVAAVGVDGVVAGVGGVGDLVGPDREGVASGDGEEDHVSIGHNGAFHRFLGIVPLGDLDFGGGQATSGEERLNRGKVGGRVGDVQLRADGSCLVELTAVALPVIDGQCVQIVACFAQMIEEDGRIKPSGINDDGFHEFSDFAGMAEPWEFSEQGAVVGQHVQASEWGKYKAVRYPLFHVVESLSNRLHRYLDKT